MNWHVQVVVDIFFAILLLTDFMFLGRNSFVLDPTPTQLVGCFSNPNPRPSARALFFLDRNPKTLSCKPPTHTPPHRHTVCPWLLFFDLHARFLLHASFADVQPCHQSTLLVDLTCGSDYSTRSTIIHLFEYRNHFEIHRSTRDIKTSYKKYY